MRASGPERRRLYRRQARPRKPPLDRRAAMRPNRAGPVASGGPPGMSATTTTNSTTGPRAAGNTVRQLALAAGYGIAWQALLPLSNVLWFLPAGLRLGALWVTPARQWGWLALGEW